MAGSSPLAEDFLSIDWATRLKMLYWAIPENIQNPLPYGRHTELGTQNFKNFREGQ